MCTRAAININNLGSVARQILRGSKTYDVSNTRIYLKNFRVYLILTILFQIMNQSIRNFTQVDIVSDYSAQNLNKMSLILQHVGYHYDTITDSVNHLDYVREQVTSMER